MTKLLHFGGVWMIGCLGITLAFFGPMHEKCAKYCSKPPPKVTGAKTVCITGWDNCTYCKFYVNNCPDIQDCNNNAAPVPSKGNHCMICPDVDCVYNGHVYYAEEMFDSVDGINKCMCLRGGHIKCEEHYLGSSFTFCS
ncbi:uncharacterized protein LOC132561715 [Ylistrum balloti]|uniref:uncharacterized protein LOC132561715 n=1 Tax=Ylistrum balloti TaxID=509963 RepID=UPI002905E41B|nr:uncharacterized protein LOC132561715 [Ylistrum balloti]